MMWVLHKNIYADLFYKNMNREKNSTTHEKNINPRKQSSSVFMKSDVKPDNRPCIELDHIMSTIPKDRYTMPQPKLADIYTEWRWRFLDINGKDYVEISRKDSGKDRLYINKNKKWVNESGLEKYDMYIIKNIYSYLDPSLG